VTKVRLQPVRVSVEEDQEGMLALVGDTLVAVLVRLSELHGEHAGAWFLEAGFGRLDLPEHPVFPDLAAAQAWIERRLAAGDGVTLAGRA
jgi:hypothetical protein